MEQSFSLKERLKKRKIARLQNKRAPKKDKKEEEYDLVYVDNSTPFTNKAQSNEADEEQTAGENNTKRPLSFQNNNGVQNKQAYYESVLSANKQFGPVGGLAIESPDVSKISNDQLNVSIPEG